MTTLERIKQKRFIVILRHIPAQYAARAAQALYDGGCRVFEVTFDPSDPDTYRETAEILRTIRAALGGDISVGAGTVLDTKMAEVAYQAGAEFLVAPNTDLDVISFAKAHGMLAVPGAFTPTEIQNAWKAGADAVKIFPILPDGEAYLKNVISPLSHIPFLVTGGITPDTIEKFLKFSPVAVAAGASIITKELCEKGDFAKITELALRHTQVADRFGT